MAPISRALATFLFALWLNLAGAQAGAPASLGPLPPQWTLSAADVLVLISPPGPGGSVTIILPPVTPAIGDLRTAFGEDVPALIEDLIGETRASQVPQPLPPSDTVPPGMRLSALVDTSDGSETPVEAQVEAIGYLVRGGMQLVLLAMPRDMPADDTNVLAARDLIESWRASSLVVSPSLTADVAARSAAPATIDGDEAETADATDPAESANPDDRVENVIHYLRYVFDSANPEEPAEPQSVTALLLKDGRVFENETAAPAAFKPAQRPLGSPGTGRWQRDGEAYALAFADGTQGTAVAAAAKTFGAPAAMTLSGTYLAAGGPASNALPHRLTFFDDGSLTMGDGEGAMRSARYSISQRTVTIGGTGTEPQHYLFGFQGPREAPTLLIVANRLYERSE